MSKNNNENTVVEPNEPKTEDGFTTYFTDGKIDIPEIEKVSF